MTRPRIQHATICAPPDLVARCVAFYVEALGLVHVPSLYPEAEWLELADGQQLHILRDAGAVHPRQHVALHVADLDATLARLAAAGAPLDAGQPLWGAPRWYTRDPAGNRVEVFAVAPPVAG